MGRFSLVLDERAADLLELGADVAQRFSIEQPCGGPSRLVLRPNAQLCLPLSRTGNRTVSGLTQRAKYSSGWY